MLSWLWKFTTNLGSCVLVALSEDRRKMILWYLWFCVWFTLIWYMYYVHLWPGSFKVSWFIFGPPSVLALWSLWLDKLSILLESINSSRNLNQNIAQLPKQLIGHLFSKVCREILFMNVKVNSCGFRLKIKQSYGATKTNCVCKLVV